MEPITNKRFAQPVNLVLCVLKTEPARVWSVEDVTREITHGDMDWAQHALGQLTATGWLEMRRGKQTDRKYYRLTDAGARARMWFPDRNFPTSDSSV